MESINVGVQIIIMSFLSKGEHESQPDRKHPETCPRAAILSV